MLSRMKRKGGFSVALCCNVLSDRFIWEICTKCLLHSGPCARHLGFGGKQQIWSPSPWHARSTNRSEWNGVRGLRFLKAGSPCVTVRGGENSTLPLPCVLCCRQCPQVQLEVASGTVLKLKPSWHTLPPFTDPQRPQVTSQSHLKSPKWWFPLAPRSYRLGTKHLSKAVSLTVPDAGSRVLRTLNMCHLVLTTTLWSAQVSSFYKSGNWVNGSQADERQNQDPA